MPLPFAGTEEVHSVFIDSIVSLQLWKKPQEQLAQAE